MPVNSSSLTLPRFASALFPIFKNERALGDLWKALWKSCNFLLRNAAVLIVFKPEGNGGKTPRENLIHFTRFPRGCLQGMCTGKLPQSLTHQYVTRLSRGCEQFRPLYYF
jgi:hypothetical protein